MKTTKKRSPGRLSKSAALVNELNSKLGTNVKLGNDPAFEIVRIPTGSLVLDRITGGGFALGRHVEIYGDESACKSFITYRAMALSQQRGKVCALIDPEHSFDRVWFKHLGGKPTELLTLHPENAEDAVAVMMMLAKHAQENGELEIITCDSVASLIPTEEISKDPREEDRIAGQARMMSRALRRITAVNRRMLFLWTNQERTNIGIRFGNPRTTSGGRALRFYATTRIEMRKGGMEKSKHRVAARGKLVERDVVDARWIQCRVEKDKSTRPYREGSFLFDSKASAIDESSEIVNLGLEDQIIERVGNQLVYTDVEGKEWKALPKRFSKWLTDNLELRDELVAQIEDNTIRGGGYFGED
jgi:recombination protein RecA